MVSSWPWFIMSDMAPCISCMESIFFIDIPLSLPIEDILYFTFSFSSVSKCTSISDWNSERCLRLHRLSQASEMVAFSFQFLDQWSPYDLYFSPHPWSRGCILLCRQEILPFQKVCVDRISFIHKDGCFDPVRQSSFRQHTLFASVKFRSPKPPSCSFIKYLGQEYMTSIDNK